MLKNISLNVKLSIPTVILCLVAVGIGWTGYHTLDSVADEYEIVTNKVMKSQNYVNEMFGTYRKVRIQARTLGLKGLTAAQGEEAVKSALEAIEEYDKTRAEYGKLKIEGEEKELVGKLDARWADFKATGAKIVRLYHSDRPQDQAELSTIFFEECPRMAKDFTVAMQDLLAYEQKTSAAVVASAQKHASSSQHLILYLIFGGLGLGVLLALLSARSASTLVKSISTIAEGLAEGANKMAEVSGVLANASEHLSASSTQQAAALQQTTAAVEQTSAMVDKNADNAQRSASVSEQSQESVAQGKRAVEEMSNAINEISKSNNEIMVQISDSNREIGEIVKMITEIGNKTKVINDIVFQTKLLSFNASVEAARAGEQGKGFAVVAEEVGNLAQMSGNSAKEITDLLDVSIKKVQDIVSHTQIKVEQLVQSGSEKVKIGAETARRCGEVLDVIVSNVTDVGSRVSEISSASQEQSNGIREINKAITELDATAQQNQQASQDAAGSAEELAQQVQTLRELVTNLNGLVSNKAVENSTGESTSRSTEVSDKKSNKKSAAQSKTEVAKVYQMKKSAGKAADQNVPSSQDARFRDI